MLEEIISQGGKIEFPAGEMKTVFPFLINKEKFAQLSWEQLLGNRAFFDLYDSRYEISVQKGSGIFSRRSILVQLSGNSLVEMKTNWTGNKGDLITRWAHRYTFRSIKDPDPQLIIEREANNQRLLSFLPQNRHGHRTVLVHPSEIELEEFVGLLIAMAFYLIIIDTNQKIAIISTPVAH